MSQAQAVRHTVLWAHLKVAAAAAVGVVAAMASHAWPATSRHFLLIGWAACALAYLGMTWCIFLSAEEDDIRARAAEHDEKLGVLLLIVLALIAASLGAIVAALLRAKGFAPQDRTISAALVALTLSLGWLMLQTVFTGHYAHRHFVEEARKAGAGFGFPGEPPASYLDFLYLAFSVGATFQVSDNTVGSTRLRKLVTAHAASAYVYNTAILAVGINLLAAFVSQ